MLIPKMYLLRIEITNLTWMCTVLDLANPLLKLVPWCGLF